MSDSCNLNAYKRSLMSALKNSFNSRNWQCKLIMLHGMCAYTYLFLNLSFKVNNYLMYILFIELELGFIIPTSSNISPHAQKRAFEEGKNTKMQHPVQLPFSTISCHPYHEISDNMEIIANWFALIEGHFSCTPPRWNRRGNFSVTLLRSYTYSFIRFQPLPVALINLPTQTHKLDIIILFHALLIKGLRRQLEMPLIH